MKYSATYHATPFIVFVYDYNEVDNTKWLMTSYFHVCNYSEPYGNRQILINACITDENYYSHVVAKIRNISDCPQG